MADAEWVLGEPTYIQDEEEWVLGGPFIELDATGAPPPSDIVVLRRRIEAA